MADEIQSFTFDEIVCGLRSALSFYAYPDERVQGDLSNDENSEFFMKSGELARKALKRYEVLNETINTMSLVIDAGDVVIRGDMKHHRDVTVIEIDGVQQQGVQRIQFEASVAGPPILRIDRIVKPRSEKKLDG